MRPDRLRMVFAFSSLLLLGAVSVPEAPVADAAMRGDTEEVRQLLASGADVNAAQGDGMTALHWAAERGDADLAATLLTAGANPEAVTRIGQYTPLHLAARNGGDAIVSLLLADGADVERRTSNSGSTALHLAASSGNTATIEALLDAGADPNARESEWEQTPLIFAASANRPDAIRLLVSRGADPNLGSKVVDLQARGRLEAKARARQREVLEALTAEGQAPTPAQLEASVLAYREVLQNPPEAEEEDDEEDDRRGTSAQAKGGLTPLLHAVRQGYEEATLALLDSGADIDRVGGAEGSSPMLLATINGQFDIAKLLLERGGDPNLASELNGATPLIAAVNAEWQPRTRFPQPQERALQEITYLDLMEALLAAGADPNARLTSHPWYMVYTGCGNGNCGLVNTEGATAFWRAAYATDVAAMRLLADHGADIDIRTKAPPRRQRRSPDEVLRARALNQLEERNYEQLSDSARVEALRAVRDGLADSVQVEYSDDDLEDLDDDTRKELIEHAERADSVRAAQPDPSGLPPVEVGGPAVHALHAATGVGYGEGFAGNAHRHVPDGWMAAAKYLIEELGVDVNLRDHNGYNAIHHAAARGDNEMIRYLVEQGGDVMAVSRRGQTTVDMANGPVQRVSPHPETVALLESLGAINNHNCMSCQ